MCSLYDKIHKFLNEWDFSLNTEIDIFEDSADLDKEVFWKCSKCGYLYKDRISEHNSFSCPCCGFQRKARMLKKISSRKLPKIKDFIFMFLINFVVLFFCNAVSFKWEIITSDLIQSFLFGLIVFLEAFIVLSNFNEIRLNNNVQYVKYRYSLFELMNKVPNVEDIKEFYFKTIERRLFTLIKEKGEGVENINTQFKLRKKNTSYLIKNYAIREDRDEFRNLLKIYRNESYFYKLFSSYKTNNLIDFSNKMNIKIIAITSIITILTLFLSLFNTINNWELFFNKLFLMLIPLFLVTVAKMISFNLMKKNAISLCLEDMCFISSSIAKKVRKDMTHIAKGINSDSLG